jgi:hypothetical protein|tara:strand:+ start:3003 stop:3212 length:210 start_codon:yes stop_codon:yes gene_type:complete
MQVIDLKEGVEHLRAFIKKATKHMPDKNNRGFEDGIWMLNEYLDGMKSLMSYVDDPMLNYYKTKQKEKN